MYRDKTVQKGALPWTAVALTEVAGPCEVQLTDLSTGRHWNVTVPDPKKQAADKDRKPGPLIPLLHRRPVGAVITFTTLKGDPCQLRVDAIERRESASS